MKNLKYFADLINKFKSIYLAGGIQFASNPNSYREVVIPFFKKNNIKVINPLLDNRNIFNSAILGYKDDMTPYTTLEIAEKDELKEAILFRQTELNDKQLIKNTDLILFYYDDRIGHGTQTEFDWAYEMKKPIIIIRTIPRKVICHWNKWKRYYKLVIEKNAIEFKTLIEMKEFFIKNLNFKEI